MSITANPFVKKGFGGGIKKKEEEDDLYEGYDPQVAADLIHSTIAAVNPEAAQNGAQAFGDFSSAGSGLSGARPPTGMNLGVHGTGSGLGTLRPPTQMNAMVASSEQPRPMTSVKGAGYSSGGDPNKARGTAFDPFQQASNQGVGPAAPLQRPPMDAPEAQAKDMEKQVNKLIEESAGANLSGNLSVALEKAKEAGKKERMLTRLREKHGMSDQINFDLTYAVCFNLANQYSCNNLYTEALNTYAIVVKNKQYPAAGRLRVNMGNIYFQQKKYPSAIKMYRMAMDQIGNTSREMRFKIMRNIGISFIKLGQFQDAIHSFEAIMDSSPAPDAQSGFNLILCYYALGDKEKMKKGFTSLLGVPEYLEDEEDFINEDGSGNNSGLNKLLIMEKEKNKILQEDELKKDRRERRKITHRYLYLAAKLIAPVIEKDMSAGYDWCIEALKAPKRVNTPRGGASAAAAGAAAAAAANSSKQGFPAIAMELEISKGIAFLKRRQIGEAIDVFKSFERKDEGLIAQAATNLSFLYFLEADYKNAEKYADLAVKADRYNAKALVNKANLLFISGMFEQAKELFLEAIGVEADCIEAIYNLGLTNKRLQKWEDGLQAFRKLHRIVPKDPQVIYHIANLFEILGDHAQAAHWFNTLHGAVPTDPKVLARLGSIYTKEDDETQAFHNFSDSYNTYPVNMEVISWLGVWYVKSELYEDAIGFFERAAEIEPGELKWQLMVASCYRRMNNYPAALSRYKHIHRQDPDNIECLKYLTNIYKELNDPQYEEYAKLLRKAERAAQSREQQMLAQNGGGGYVKGEMKDDDGQSTARATAGKAPSTSPTSSSRELMGSLGGGIDASGKVAETLAEMPQKPIQTLNSGAGARDEEWGDEPLPDELLP